MLAIRIARVATGRQKVVRFSGHYHGWLDPLFVDMSVTPALFGEAPLTAGQSITAGSDIIMCD